VLVYGDPKFTARLHPLHAQICVLAHRARKHPRDVDLLRSLLIACGQVEQGAHDALAEALPPAAAEPLVAAFHQATAHAAAAFYSLACRQPEPLPSPVEGVQFALNHLLRCLESPTRSFNS
jgi:hypothetical protein